MSERDKVSEFEGLEQIEEVAKTVQLGAESGSDNINLHGCLHHFQEGLLASATSICVEIQNKSF